MPDDLFARQRCGGILFANTNRPLLDLMTCFSHTLRSAAGSGGVFLDGEVRRLSVYKKGEVTAIGVMSMRPGAHRHQVWCHLLARPQLGRFGKRP